MLCGQSLEQKQAKTDSQTVPRHQNSAKRGKTARAAGRGAGHARGKTNRTKVSDRQRGQLMRGSRHNRQVVWSGAWYFILFDWNQS
jgi:hypothetical protein